VSARSKEIRAATRRAVDIIAKADRGGDSLLVRLLRPLFALFSTETQLKLGRPAFNDMTAAILLSEEHFGRCANVRVDGNVCQVGYTLDNGDMVVLGQGLSWREAFADAAARDEEAVLP